MRAPLSWIRDYVELPADVTTEQLTDRLTALGLKLEGLHRAADSITGPLVIGKVLTQQPEAQKNGKTINWCTVDVGDANGTGEPQGIVCGAHNFGPGDLVVVILPGGVLPGNFEIAARKTYGHVSAGMICSARELGLGEDHDGIIVLPPDAGVPGEPAFAALGMDDEIIEFEINPDRAYALSLRGVAREAALGFGGTFTDPAARELPVPNDEGYPIECRDPVGNPVFAARVVSGFDPAAESPEWLQRRVTQAGMRPISLVVDVSNYVMLELGQPNHTYDADKVRGPIVVRRAEPGEKLTTLDDVVRTLDPADLVIVDDSGVIGLAGVMGGASTEISASTTRVLIEAAHWNAVDMFRTGRRHKLTSEAGKRNERGVDPTLPLVAVERVAELLVELGGGTLEPGITLVGTPPHQPTISMAVDLPARVTGMPILPEATVSNLRAVGCAVDVSADGTQLSATVPAWRPDLSDPFDLVEEVARIVGYDEVPSVLPTARGGRGLTRGQKLRRRAGRALAGAGFTEIVSFPFIGEADLDRLRLGAGDARRRVLKLANPLSAEEPFMTSTLLPGLLKAAARNVGLAATDLALCEVATVTWPRADAGAAPILGVDARPSAEQFDALLAALPEQPWTVGLVLCGEREQAGWWGAGQAATWADAIDAARQIAQSMGLTLTAEASDRAPWHPGRCAELSVNGRVVGHAGELHPAVCADYGVPARSAAAELNLDTLIELADDRVSAPSFSSYPVAKEDVALVVDAAVPAAEVADALRAGAGDLLESMRLFDVYTGPQVGEGKKSLAFALRFRASDRTLAEGESTAARQAAVDEAARRLGAVQRT
ncbi:MAG: phenylalanine--tRNA ligase subunit beta [Nocardioides sp.]